MSSLKNTSMDGKLMTEKDAKKAFDRNISKGRKMMLIFGESWVSFDERKLTTTTEGQTEVTTDGHTTLTIKNRRLMLTIKGKPATIEGQEITSGGETPTHEWVNEWTTLTTKGQSTVAGQATASGQEMTTGQTTPTGQGMTSDEQTTLATEELSQETRLVHYHHHMGMLRSGHDKTTTDGRITLSTDVQVTDEQAMGTTVEQMTGTVEQTTTSGLDEQLMTIVAEEMVVEVDPLALSPADTITASPVKEVLEVDVGDAVVVAGPNVDGLKSPISIGRKVVGRSHPVLKDEDSDVTSVVSISSADEEYSAATSSSRPGRGVKRGRKPVKGKVKAEKGNSEDGKMKKKGKKKDVGRKDTPEMEESPGKHGKPKGMFDHDLEDMSSEVLGDAIQEWADIIEDIRSKSKNMQGRLSGMMKKSVAQIKEGTALLVARSTASGDPKFLRNAEY